VLKSVISGGHLVSFKESCSPIRGKGGNGKGNGGLGLKGRRKTINFLFSRCGPRLSGWERDRRHKGEDGKLEHEGGPLIRTLSYSEKIKVFD